MILVLGIGSTVMSDDGAAPRVIKRLKQRFSFPPDVEILDGATLDVGLLPSIEGLKRLIIIDTVETGGPPGSMVRLTGDEVSAAMQTKVSPYPIGLQDLLAKAYRQGQTPKEMILWGIQPASIETGTELTPQVEAALDRLTAAVAAELDWSRVDHD